MVRDHKRDIVEVSKSKGDETDNAVFNTLLSESFVFVYIGGRLLGFLRSSARVCRQSPVKFVVQSSAR